MGLSARQLDLTATWHSVKPQQQCMTLKWIHRTAQCKHMFSVIEQNKEQNKSKCKSEVTHVHLCMCAAALKQTFAFHFKAGQRTDGGDL